jgi:fatty-acyl-CoA synthase
MASALSKYGIGKGHTVSLIAQNIPEHFELHFAVPMCGAVLNSINTRLDSQTFAFILQHADAKVLFVDREFSEMVAKALDMIPNNYLVIDIDDLYWQGGELIGSIDYEAFLATVNSVITGSHRRMSGMQLR